MGDAALENWGAGEAYERYVGRWSRPVARLFLDWLAVPAGGTWADVGCGTGALTAGILRDFNPASVVGVDRAEGFVADARRRTSDARARFMVGDASALPLPDAACDATVSGLVLNFIPDPAAMLRELVRVTRPGGTVAAYVWDYAGGMTMMRHFWDAAQAVHPEGAGLDEAGRFPLCQPAPLAALWEGGGLTAVDVRALETETVFQDFDDYWTPFLGGQGAAPTYLASLAPETQAQIREVLRDRLAMDGPIPLSARAWAVRGTVA